MEFIKRRKAAFAGLGAGLLGGVVAILLGGVMYSGEGVGTTQEPPEQIYFF